MAYPSDKGVFVDVDEVANEPDRPNEECKVIYISKMQSKNIYNKINNERTKKEKNRMV